MANISYVSLWLQVISGQSVLSAIEQVGSESGSTRLKGKEIYGLKLDAWNTNVI